MAHWICEGIWIRKVLEEIEVQIEGLIQFYYNNQSAISIAKNLVHHDKTKHVEIDRHFIKDIFLVTFLF